MRRGRTSKVRSTKNLPSAELAQNEMSWGGEGEGRRGARTSRTGLGLAPRKAKKTSTTRSLSRQAPATAPMRRGKAKRAQSTAKKSVGSKAGRKSSRTRRSRAT